MHFGSALEYRWKRRNGASYAGILSDRLIAVTEVMVITMHFFIQEVIENLTYAKI